MIDPATIDRATRLLLAAAPPGSRVILFGSQATGRAGARSDVDLLVVRERPCNQIKTVNSRSR